VPLIRSDACATANMDFDSLESHGTYLGTAGLIVMDKSTDVVDAIRRCPCCCCQSRVPVPARFVEGASRRTLELCCGGLPCPKP
jgi:hypothetical protein